MMQELWLANPWDGPEPDDNRMFMENARDTILRIRNHASIGLYCGRNEGYAPKPLDDGAEVVNHSGGNAGSIIARAEALNLDGSRQWEKTEAVDSKEDSVVTAFRITFPEGLTRVHFIRLKLMAGDRILPAHYSDD